MIKIEHYPVFDTLKPIQSLNSIIIKGFRECLFYVKNWVMFCHFYVPEKKSLFFICTNKSTLNMWVIPIGLHCIARMAFFYIRNKKTPLNLPIFLATIFSTKVSFSKTSRKNKMHIWQEQCGCRDGFYICTVYLTVKLRHLI